MLLLLKLFFKNAYRFFTESTSRNFYLLVLKISRNKRYTPGKVSIGKYKLTYSDNLSFIWQYSEIFKEQFYHFNTPTPAPLIYDCGSNIGISCLYFKFIYPQAKIVAFEADPTICNVLEQNMVQNGVNNISIRNEAVWINKGGIEISCDGADSASIYTTTQKTIKVGSVRLKELLDQEQGTIDFLKMDIEGAEKKVIPDCGESLQKIKRLFIEYHDYKGVTQDLDVILNTLSRNGFSYYLLNAQTHKAPFLLLDNGKQLQLNIFATRTT